MFPHSKRLCLSFITLLGIANLAFAGSTPFSPYADVTINAHWDSHYQDMEPMDLIQVSQQSGVQSYHLAFITDAGTCEPAWGSQSSYSVKEAWASHLTDALRKNNIHYWVSLGGATGNDLSAACSETALVATYNHILEVYKPTGLDFDIENGTAKVEKVIQALVAIQHQHPETKLSFTLPTLPEGLTASGEEIIKLAAAAKLNFTVNIMAMDYGPGYVNDMGEYAIQAATNLMHFLQGLYPTKSVADLWKMIEVTPMIGVNDVSVEEFTLKNVDTLAKFAKQNQLAGLSMWSVARDNPCADKWASPICSGNNLQVEKYEFAKRFLGASN